ncbi:hypothetical protein lerEdw1_016945, partial [Lerista edwardsae]
ALGVLWDGGGVMAVTVLCRRFSSALRLTGAAWGGPAAASFRSYPSLKYFLVLFVTFTGDSWTVEQLRGKSSEDLHKLWYVLLKERNMLLTLEQEAKRQRLPMPSPERLEKVQDSMERMDLVIQEREDALRLLQTGQEKERPGEWRHNFLGRTVWYDFKEWPIPWYLNARHNRKRFFYLPRVERFNRLFLEKYLRQENKKKRLQREKERMLKAKFPHLAAQSQT